MSNRRTKRKWKLWHQDPHCHWCGCLTIRGPIPDGESQPDNLATLDHLDDRLCPHRGAFRDGVTPRTVLACRRCNNLRAAEGNGTLPKEEQWRRSGRAPQEERSA